MAFVFYSSFCKCAKRGRKIIRKKTKKLSQFLKSHISGTLEAILLKFGMWSAEGGGSVHSKNRLVSSRKHRATEVRKLRFLSSCQYTQGCYAPASWATLHTTVCLDLHWIYLLIEHTHSKHLLIVHTIASPCGHHDSVTQVNAWCFGLSTMTFPIFTKHITD